MALGLFAAASLFFVGVTLSPLKSGFADAPARGPGDVALYRAEIDHIHSGKNYYTVAAAELRSRGYPTRSVFNWRTPLPMWLIGKLPAIELGKVLLGGIAMGLMLLAFGLMCDEANPKAAFLTTVFLAGAMLPIALGDLFVMTELWSGTLMALSAVALGLRRTRLGVITGIAALFMRELAAPYCAVCLLLAIRNRQWSEVRAWLLGFTAYACFYAVHLVHVLPLIHATDVAHEQGWIRFGGAGFVISTAQMNAWLLLLPQWVTALYLAAAMLGLAYWNTPAGQRIGLTVALYLIAFSIVGQPINQYWGSMIAPLLCLGAAQFPAAIAGLAGRAWVPRVGC